MSKGWNYNSGDWNLTKCCSVCKQEKELDSFYMQKDGKYGVASRCKPCLLLANKKYVKPDKTALYTETWRNKGNNRELARVARREWQKNNLAYDAYRAAIYRATKKSSTPSWADLTKIKQIYLACPPEYHVDHIIPLRGKLVCGLHVEYNLQYLTVKDNLRKRNSHVP
jgi:hypothetical protein